MPFAGESEPVPFMTEDFCDHRAMQIVFLGTSSSMPTLSRNTSSIALRLGQSWFNFLGNFLIDILRVCFISHQFHVWNAEL